MNFIKSKTITPPCGDRVRQGTDTRHFFQVYDRIETFPLQLEYRGQIITENPLDIWISFQERIRLLIHQPGYLVICKGIEDNSGTQDIPQAGNLADT